MLPIGCSKLIGGRHTIGIFHCGMGYSVRLYDRIDDHHLRSNALTRSGAYVEAAKLLMIARS